MSNEETFFDAELREALSDETPPDVLARVMARSRAEGIKPRELESADFGRGTAGKPTTRRWLVARVLGALCLSVLAGGAVAWAAAMMSPATEPAQDEFEVLSAKLAEAERRVHEADQAEALREAQVRAIEGAASTLEDRVATPEEKVERALAEVERKRRERMEQAEIQRRERHLAWVQEVRKAEKAKILDGLMSQVGLSDEQKTQAAKVLDDWGNEVYGTFKGHYRDRRRHEPRETMRNVAALNQTAVDALRGMLDGRQQLAFDGWLAKDGGRGLVNNGEAWIPPAVDVDDMNAFDEWR